MFRKLLKPLAAATFAATMMLPQAAMAATTVNASPAASASSQLSSSPAVAAPATDGWTAIQPGESQWYTFKYDYDAANRPAQIRMYTQPNESVTLMLLNGNEARDWQQVGGERQHFGAATTVYDTVVDTSVHHAVHTDGTRDYDFSKKDAPTTTEKGTYASWSGVIGNSGTYSILIHRDARATGPANYQFTVNGDGLTSLQPAN